MFQFIFGFVAGAYTAQKYDIPKIENIFNELFNNLKSLEKKSIDKDSEEIKKEEEDIPTQVNTEKKKKFKFF